MSQAKVAITGASGFLGRNTVRRACEMGLRPLAIVRSEHHRASLEALGAEVMVAALAAEELAPCFAGARAVVHVAGVTGGSRELFEEVNVRGTAAVARAARQAGARVVFVSGLGVDPKGSTGRWAHNAYFDSKRAAEAALSAEGGDHVALRPSYILGPHDELIPWLVGAVRSGIVPLVEGGTTPLQPLFVDDAAGAFLVVAQGRLPHGAVLDLVGPTVVTMRALVAMVTAVLRERGVVSSDPRIDTVPKSHAPSLLGLSAEEVDVMSCDVLGDAQVLERALGIELTPLHHAIRTAVLEELS